MKKVASAAGVVIVGLVLVPVPAFAISQSDFCLILDHGIDASPGGFSSIRGAQESANQWATTLGGLAADRATAEKDLECSIEGPEGNTPIMLSCTDHDLADSSLANVDQRVGKCLASTRSQQAWTRATSAKFPNMIQYNTDSADTAIVVRAAIDKEDGVAWFEIDVGENR